MRPSMTELPAAQSVLFLARLQQKKSRFAPQVLNGYGAI
jgi:hypothetical protein